MNFKEKINLIINNTDKNKRMSFENKEYFTTLLEDLLFKYNAVMYHHKNLLQKKKRLEQESKIRCKKNERELKEVKEFWTNDKINEGSAFFELKFIDEIDSNELFYEFESLLYETISFIDYSIKIIKIFYPHLNGSKSKIINSFKNKYPSSDLYKLFKLHFEGWIYELIKYRDHICHLSSLNSHLKSLVNYSSEYQRIEKEGDSIHVTLRPPNLNVDMSPIYLPIEPDYRHKIIAKLEDKEINYEEDFYTLEEYLDKLMINFNKFSYEVIKEFHKKVNNPV